jgi:hypothetical protein
MALCDAHRNLAERCGLLGDFKKFSFQADVFVPRGYQCDIDQFGELPASDGLSQDTLGLCQQGIQ